MQLLIEEFKFDNVDVDDENIVHSFQESSLSTFRLTPHRIISFLSKSQNLKEKKSTAQVLVGYEFTTKITALNIIDL